MGYSKNSGCGCSGGNYNESYGYDSGDCGCGCNAGNFGHNGGDCGCGCNGGNSGGCGCDLSFDTQGTVAFAPEAYAASNCGYFAVATPEITKGKTFIVFLKNPKDNDTGIFINITSATNFNNNSSITRYIVQGLKPCDFKTCNLDIYSTNFGCEVNTNVQASFAVLKYPIKACDINNITQDIQGPSSTVRIDRAGGFVIPPGETFAYVLVSQEGCLDVACDIRWWEVNCQ